MTSKTIRVLSVSSGETRRTVRAALAAPFRGIRFEVHEADTIASGLEIASGEAIDCALVGRVPEGPPRETIALVSSTRPGLTVVVLDAESDEQGQRLLKSGAHEYLTAEETTADLIARTVCHAVERHRLSMRVTELATHDELTNVFTRRHLLERLPQMTALSVRHKYPLTIALCDLKHLESINERFGNATGDRVLTHLAEVIQKTVRKEDPVGRFGEDEICVVFSHCTQEQGVGIIQRIRDNFDHHEFYAGLDDRFTAAISCGLAEFLPWETIEQWIYRAGAALSEAKRNSILGISLAENELSPVSDI